MLGFIGSAYRGARDFFVASWEYLKSSNATFNSLGDKLITSAKNDLLNLKDKLDRLWEIQEQDRETTALYLSAVLGKFGFTFIIIGVSMLASLIKLTCGSVCLLLAGRWLSLISKIFNIFREVLSYSLTFLRDNFRKLLTNALELISKMVRKFGEYAGRFINASLDFLQAAFSYIKPIWQMALDFAAAAWRAIRRFAVNVLQNFGSAIINCFKGVGHLIVGTLKASTIVAKGLGLSVAALFIETGIANVFSGVAKAMFILEESFAAGVGALMDGVYASGNSFLKAAKSMFGYGDAVPVTDSVHSNNYIVIASEPGDSTYYSRKARDNAHYVNECFASAGNGLLNVYQKQKDQMIGASGWSDVEDVAESEIIRLVPARMAVI